MSDTNYQKLPPGWDCKYDQATGNCYYINYFTKVMQLEDPRSAQYKQLQNERCSTESIPLQHLVTHVGGGIGSTVGAGGSSGASPYHVYPSNSLTAVRAFQERNNPHSRHNISTSPLLTSSRGQLDMSSPLPYQRALHTQARRSTIQETSFTNAIDTDAVVAKIQNMFPTASENHIRLLLKRYYNREAVVISALQVEKHPLTMPGPYVTPPAQRHLFHSNSAFYMTPPSRRLDMAASRIGGGVGGIHSRTASPIPGVVRFGSVMSVGGADTATVAYQQHMPGGAIHHLNGSPRFMPEMWRSSPKPHSSPKMKLRYMKNIFPKADEMLLLDILANADNNVQKASEKLKSLGYAKREFVPHKANNRPPTNVVDGALSSVDAEQHIPLRPKEYNQQEKQAMQVLLKEKYPKIAERIILMALESVNYAEDRAMQILQIVQQEDEQRDKQQQRQQFNAAAQRSQSLCMPEESESEATARMTDSILTVTVLETSNDITSKQQIKQQKHKLPIINVTTPTTATTQIILNNSPITEVAAAATHNIQNEHKKITTSSTPTSSSSSSSSTTSTHAYISPAHSPTRYERLTTKSMLGNSSCSGGGSGGINGYLHGSCNSFSYKTFSTTTTAKRTSYSSYGITTNFSSTASSKSSSSRSSSSTTKNTNASVPVTAGVIERTRTKFESLKNSQRSSDEYVVDADLEQSEFKSIIERMSTLGHNPSLAKGPDDSLLLADYVPWNGANPCNNVVHRQLASGPNSNLLSERSYKAVGRNAELCKGANSSLVKGSIYAQLATTTSTAKSANIKCN